MILERQREKLAASFGKRHGLWRGRLGSGPLGWSSNGHGVRRVPRRRYFPNFSDFPTLEMGDSAKRFGMTGVPNFSKLRKGFPNFGGVFERLFYLEVWKLLTRLDRPTFTVPR